jgi:hypothetical protein
MMMKETDMTDNCVMLSTQDITFNTTFLKQYKF